MGRWEDAVVRVTIAGDPGTVHQMGHRWNAVSTIAPDFGIELEKMVTALTTGPHAWRGKAAQEFENVVKQISKNIQHLADDTGQMSSNLDDAHNVLRDAIANIPVPLLRAGHWYTGGNEHKLPGGTDMDDGHKMQQQVGGFIDTLRADYERNKDAYQDFKKAVEAEYDGPTPTRNNFKYDVNDPTVPASDLRSGTQHGAAYRGDFDKINAWYDANAKVADHHFSALKDSYVEHRGRYRFDSLVDPLKLSLQAGGHQAPPGGGETGYGAAGAGGAGYDPSGFDPSSVLTNWSGAGNESPGGAGTDPSASTDWWTPADANTGSRLAGSGPSGAGGFPGGSAGLGGGIGGGGLGAGGIGGVGLGSGSAAGVGTSGYVAPIPPVTTPPTPALDAARAARPGAGRPGTGMMPHPGSGGRRGEGNERTTWLTEDEDVFGPRHTAPKTNSAGAIE